MANDVFFVAVDCHSCAKARGTVRKQQRPLNLFSKAESLEFEAMYFLRSSPKTKRGQQVVLLITNRLSRLVRSVLLQTTTATVVANAFLDHWVNAEGTPAYLLTDSRSQLVDEFFDVRRAIPEAKSYFATVYLLQDNRQTVQFSKTIVQRLQRYDKEHQSDQDIYFQSLTYAYSLRVQRSAETTLIDLVRTRHCSGLVMTEVTRGGRGPAVKEKMRPVQYRRATLCRLMSVLTNAR